LIIDDDGTQEKKISCAGFRVVVKLRVSGMASDADKAAVTGGEPDNELVMWNLCACLGVSPSPALKAAAVDGDTHEGVEHHLSDLLDEQDESSNDEEDSILYASHVPWKNANEDRKRAASVPDAPADSDGNVQGNACAVDIRFWRRERKVQNEEEDSEVEVASHIPWTNPNEQQCDSLKKKGVASSNPNEQQRGSLKKQEEVASSNPNEQQRVSLKKGEVASSIRPNGYVPDGQHNDVVVEPDAPSQIGAMWIVGPGEGCDNSYADTIIYDAPGLPQEQVKTTQSLYETEARVVDNEDDTSFLLRRIRELEEGQQQQVVITAEAMGEAVYGNSDDESTAYASDRSGTKTWKSRILWKVLLAFALVAAVIVGVVLGTKQRDQTRSDPSSVVSPSPTDGATSAPTTDSGNFTAPSETTTPALTLFPTSTPSSLAPTAVATFSPPTQRLTASPSVAPTSLPVADPPSVILPTAGPPVTPPTPVPTTLQPITNPPTVPPTFPTLPPTTQSPMDAPTPAPTLPPVTDPPTNLPTPVPIILPTTNPPTESPTLLPTTQAPTVFLTPAPSLLPVTDPPTSNSPSNILTNPGTQVPTFQIGGGSTLSAVPTSATLAPPEP